MKNTLITATVLFVALLSPQFVSAQSYTGSGATSGSSGSPPDRAITGTSIQATSFQSASSSMPSFKAMNTLSNMGNTEMFGGGAPVSNFADRASSSSRSTTSTRSTSRTTSRSTNRNMTMNRNTMNRGGMGANSTTIQSVTSFDASTMGMPSRSVGTGNLRVAGLENHINARFNPAQPISIEAAGSTVTIRGTVHSEQQRRVMEQAIRMEPGISRVKNELAIVPVVQ